MRTLFRTILHTYYAINIAFILWVVASWADVVLHNASTCIYQPWNCFVILLEAVK